MSTTFQGPFLIQAIGAPLADVCLQASFAGVDATVNIAPIDAAGATPLQQWLYGSDHRLYLHAPGSTPAFCIDFVNPAENGTPLRVDAVIPSDQTQQWIWSGRSNTSTFNNMGAPGFVFDNSGGGTGTGNKVQLFQAQNGNPNQSFAMILIPALAASK